MLSAVRLVVEVWTSPGGDIFSLTKKKETSKISLHMQVEKGLAVMVAAKRSTSVIPEMKLRNTNRDISRFTKEGLQKSL